MVVEERVELKKGLKDVYFDRSTISKVDPAGKLHYRGYDIHDLADHSTFEETCYLLLYGSLPTRAALEQFEARFRAARAVHPSVLGVIESVKTAHPMDVLRTAVSADSASAVGLDDHSPESTIDKGIALTAQVATMVAAHARIREGKEPVAPRDDLNHAANFLYMMFGREPEPEDVELIDKDFVLHAEHGVNASTFGARVTAATGADYYATITSAIAVLKGPKHGGAAENVMNMALEVGSEENAEAYVRDRLQRGERIMGFGHPVYRALDPRSIHLREGARLLGERRGQPKWFSIIQAITETEAMRDRARFGILPNVDLWSGAVYYLLGVPEDMFVPMFALGRMPGWTAHVIEQFGKKDILRPRLLYIGPLDVPYVPIEER